MEKTLKFYKDSEGIFIDLPDFPGLPETKGELAMVSGADNFLELVAQRFGIDLDKGLYLELSDSAKNLDWDGLIVKDNTNIANSGCNYVAAFMTEEFHSMWLCDVTKYVFGQFPNHLVFKVIE